MTPEQIKEKYDEPIMDILSDISSYLADSGHYIVGTPFDMHSNTYQWLFTLYRRPDNSDLSEPDNKDIDFTITIAESEFWVGKENGVNFMFDIVEWGGRIIGNFAPGNYTENCWVCRDDDAAVEARFQLFKKGLEDLSAIGGMIDRWVESHPLKVA